MNTETKRRNVKTGGYCSDTLHAKRDRKRAEAEKRQAIYSGLTFNQKLKLVDGRPGQSRREWLRLTGEDVNGGARGGVS